MTTPGTPVVSVPSYVPVAFNAPTVALDGVVTSVTLASTSGAAQLNVPFTFGHVFKAGELAPSSFLVGKIAGQPDLLLQFNPKATHGDGSVRHAIISGVLPSLAAGASVQMGLARAAAGASTVAEASTALTSSGFSCSATAVIGGVTWTASPMAALTAGMPGSAVWIGGDVATEWRVSVPFKNGAATHPTLTAEFDIRHYPSTSKTYVNAAFENCKAYASSTDVIYDAALLIGGATVWSQLNVIHYALARYRKFAWAGAAPSLHIKHSTGYLLDTMAVPNYDRNLVADEPTLALYATLAANNVGVLKGRDNSAMTLAGVQALNGTLTLNVDDYAPVTATVNLAGATSLTNAATLIQAAFPTAGIAVVFNGGYNRFEIRSTYTGRKSAVLYAGGTIADGLYLTKTAGAEVGNTWGTLGNTRFVRYMPTTGGRPDIGLMPDSFVMTLLSMDKRAKDLMLDQADAMGCWAAHRRDDSTGPAAGLQLDVIHWPRCTLYGTQSDSFNGATGGYEKFPDLVTSNPNSADESHQAAGSYLPYLLTGDHYYLDELLFWANNNLCTLNPEYRNYSEGRTSQHQIRAQAWTLRTLGEAAYVCPDSHPLKATQLYFINKNIAYYRAKYVTASNNQLGINMDGYSLGDDIGLGNYTSIQPWQDDFFTSAIGHLTELGFGTGDLLYWKAKWPVNRMIGTGVCFTHAATYALRACDSTGSPLYTTFPPMYVGVIPANILALPCNSQARTDLINSTYGQTLQIGDMLGYPAQDAGFVANMQPAIAMAANSGFPDADLAWSLFDARPTKPNYAASPQFAIVPRAAGTSFPPYTPPSGPPAPIPPAPSPTTGPTMTIADRVKETTTATNTTTIALAGPVPKYRSFAAGFAQSDPNIPVVVEDAAGNWEYGMYTLTSAALLTRTAIIGSSNNGAAVNFPAGVKDVYCDLPASLISKFIPSDAAAANAVAASNTSSLVMVEANVPKRITLDKLVAAMGGSMAALPAAAALGSGDIVTVTQGSSLVRTTLGALGTFLGANAAVPASAVTISLSSSSVVSGNPVTVTVGTDHALTGSQSESIALVAPVAGAWSTNPVVLNAATGTATATFTPSATGSGSGNVTATATGTPALTAASTALTVTAAATAPGAPTIGTAVAGDGYIDVAFTAPASNGGSAILDYTATLSTGQTATGAASPIRVTAPNGTAATATVKARNVINSGVASAASNSVTPSAPAYATLNPGDTNSSLVLSNGNKTVTGGGSIVGFGSSRATLGVATGKKYWEATISSVTGAPNFILGIGTLAANINSYPGNDVNGYGYYSNGQTLHTAEANGYGAAYGSVVGDVIGFALDMDAGTLTCYRNNLSQGGMAFNLVGTFFPMASTNAPTHAITMNFGASAFAFAPPAGFTGLLG